MKLQTISNAKKWAKENDNDLNSARMKCKDSGAQLLNTIMPEKAKELWDSGSWLSEQLDSLGATDEQIKDIQFAHGQRAFGGDPWKVAVKYVNEFMANGDTKEKPGSELAAKINTELFG